MAQPSPHLPGEKGGVRTMPRSYQELGCNISIKKNFLFGHLEQFSNNLGDYSNEKVERFHQELKTMEERYKERWDMNMMPDFC